MLSCRDDQDNQLKQNSSVGLHVEEASNNEHKQKTKMKLKDFYLLVQFIAEYEWTVTRTKKKTHKRQKVPKLLASASTNCYLGHWRGPEQ